ncbi:hypothetical protein MROS_1033 [Melioribacter roseus P3M-2]|uniref:Uncharacterized protein n=1 Tax=Melioribacter roseus (strain DSM 23840 / JCM 17771 / VKM B-2668 / P3M-2) TaxID=1191523 RepID=I6ZZ30_MELRP|nr:hypothetical protein [Melioribacter roseus]AFN74273.1 hypothetical protein MROS_1033 [Melioribacter roseus P3M-2]
MNNKQIRKWIPSLFFIPAVIYLIYNRGRVFLLDELNLLIHEGGHGVFAIFGKFVYTLGGTLMQIIIPSLFIFYYYKEKKYTAARIFLLWLGQNLINISVYAADASEKKLRLIGGNNVYHDWNYMLGRLNLLEHDKTIGTLFYVLAMLVFVYVLVMPLFIREYKRLSPEEEDSLEKIIR